MTSLEDDDGDSSQKQLCVVGYPISRTAVAQISVWKAALELDPDCTDLPAPEGTKQEVVRELIQLVEYGDFQSRILIPGPLKGSLKGLIPVLTYQRLASLWSQDQPLFLGIYNLAHRLGAQNVFLYMSAFIAEICRQGCTQSEILERLVFVPSLSK